MKSKFRKIPTIFDIENLKILTPPHYTNSQNSIISFRYVDNLILYPRTWNSIACIAIVNIYVNNSQLRSFLLSIYLQKSATITESTNPGSSFKDLQIDFFA